MTNKTATIIENIVLFDVSAYVDAIIRNKRNATVKGKIRMQFRTFVLCCVIPTLLSNHYFMTAAHNFKALAKHK